MIGMVAAGYFGRPLVVDVGDATAATLPLSDEVLRSYLGGAGLRDRRRRAPARAARDLVPRPRDPARQAHAAGRVRRWGWQRGQRGAGHRAARQPAVRPGERRVATPVFGLSALLSVLTAADGFVVVPEEATGLDAGTEVDVTLYR
jgi:molybdopterin biosynthesis enzyme